jgi:hypothetical protein
MQLRMPPNGRISRSAVERAIEVLGIEWDVQIRWADAENMRSPSHVGECESYDGKRLHVIGLRPGRSAAATSKTLLHELGHAVQVEESGSAARWRRAYLDRAQDYEAHAAEIARCLDHLQVVTDVAPSQQGRPLRWTRTGFKR